MSWLRINRWWLVALPFAIAVLVGGSAQRIKPQWYDLAPHHRLATARPGEFVSVTDEFEDLDGSTSRQFRVRFASVARVTHVPASGAFYAGEDPPPGTEALAVRLDWKAAPTQVMIGCTVELVDDRGRRYEVPAGDSNIDQCVPPTMEGPFNPENAGDPRGQHDQGDGRRPSWSSFPTFLVPRGTTVAKVRVWWSLPDYVELPAP